MFPPSQYQLENQGFGWEQKRLLVILVTGWVGEDPKTWYRYRLGCPPSQDSSHHQDYYIFRIGDPNLNLYLLGGGTIQSIDIVFLAYFQSFGLQHFGPANLLELRS